MAVRNGPGGTPQTVSAQGVPRPAFAGARFHVLHAAGERDLHDLHAPGPHYDPRGYVSRFSEAILASDLVVARAGGSIFEIAAQGKPAVLVPYPLRHRRPPDRQRTLHGASRRGGGHPRPRAHAGAPGPQVGRLLADPGRLTAMARASAGLARPNAARDIAHELLSAARGG